MIDDYYKRLTGRPPLRICTVSDDPPPSFLMLIIGVLALLCISLGLGILIACWQQGAFP
jgi:hypothetical protein